MGFGIGSITGAFKNAANWVGDKAEDGAQAVGSAAGAVADAAGDVIDEGAKAVGQARDFVGDRLEDIDQAKAWVGGQIDGAVEGAEHAVDGFRQDLVEFGEEHGGLVGKTIAQNVSNTIGVVEGGTLAVYDMGKGVVQLADGAGKLVNPLEWATHGGENLQRLETAGKAAGALGNLANPVAWATQPEANVNTAKALWNGVTEGYQDAAKSGDWSKFIGRGVVDVGSLFIGVGEANAAIKGAEGASAVAKLGEGANALDKVADGARALDAAGDAGKAAEAASGAGKTASGLGKAKIDEILALPKGTRPNPLEYLSETYISEHLAQFDAGATRFMTETNLSKYGIGQRDGTSFVMPKAEADQLLASTKGDPRALEEALGLPKHFLDDNALVRVDIPKPKELNLRVPSGNEAGANDLWIPGGKLPTGSSEAVIDVKGIADTRYSTTPVQ